MTHNYHAIAMRRKVAEQTRWNPAFRRSARKRAIKTAVGNVAGVALIVVAALAVAALVVCFFTVAAALLTIFVVYRVVLVTISDISKAVRARKDTSPQK